MFNHWNHPSRIATTAAAMLLGITLATHALALDDCRVPTPNPCGVDGVCRPNVFSYGHYKTRWRPWPGEEKQLGATPDAADPSKQELNLDPFQRPMPEQEDLRGPAKTKTNKSSRDSDAEEAGEDTIQPQLDQPQLEEEEAFPEFELQGNLPLMPIPTDDAPPALPQSLQQASAYTLGTQVTKSTRFQPQPPVRLATATASIQSAQPGLAQNIATRTQPVVKANFSVSKQPQLVNPAAGSVVPQNELSKAAYFEATDLPPSSAGH